MGQQEYLTSSGIRTRRNTPGGAQVDPNSRIAPGHRLFRSNSWG